MNEFNSIILNSLLNCCSLFHIFYSSCNWIGIIYQNSIQLFFCFFHTKEQRRHWLEEGNRGPKGCSTKSGNESEVGA